MVCAGFVISFTGEGLSYYLFLTKIAECVLKYRYLDYIFKRIKIIQKHVLSWSFKVVLNKISPSLMGSTDHVTRWNASATC